jgi:uncharacterized SAM-binding protein YcdF (DUF218 family)
MSSPASSNPTDRKPRHVRRKLLLAAVLAVLAYFVAVGVLIVRQSQRDEARAADAIVVFGAAEYAGRPSPVYRARLDHGYDLFQQQLANLIITTGGSADDPHYSEGGVGRDYLVRRGIPEERIIAETQSSNTDISAERVANIMRANGMKTCVAVSDPYHLFRIKHMLGSQGVTVYASPRAELRPLGLPERALTIGREALSYTLWKLHVT